MSQKIFSQELNDLKNLNRYRTLLAIQSPSNPTVQINGDEFLLFCSNNYLGLASDPRLAQAGLGATHEYGWGAGSSRLLSGTTALHGLCEQKISEFKGVDGTLLFANGYQANLGVIPAITSESDLILSDELNHASLIDGCRLSKARVSRFAHRSVQDLEENLKTSQSFRRRIILTESVFSMEGSLAPLDRYAQLAKKYEALLYVDDAHGFGVLGDKGQGALSHFQLPENDPTIIQMGTLGKALGGFGAFLCCSVELRDLLINKARTFIYSTALPAAFCASCLKGLTILQEEKVHLFQLRKNCKQFSNGLKSLGLPILKESQFLPIQPVFAGSEEKALEIERVLFERGIFARAIRPPTVPFDQCRIRFSLMSTHNDEQIKKVLGVLKETL